MILNITKLNALMAEHKKQGKTREHIAWAMGMSPVMLRNIIFGISKTPKIDTMYKIMEYFGDFEFKEWIIRSK